MTVALPVQNRVSLSILPQTMGRQESTSCPSISCYSGPFCMPSAGGGGGEEEREGLPLGHPSLLILLLITFLNVSPRLNNNNSSSGLAQCVNCIYRKDHYKGWLDNLRGTLGHLFSTKYIKTFSGLSNTPLVT